MEIRIDQLRGVDIISDDKEVTVVFNEYDGSWYGGKTAIKIIAKSYEMLEQAVVEKWLENKKSLITE